MRFLDHVPTKKIIMEAGIADVGVMLKRLVSELVAISQNNQSLNRFVLADTAGRAADAITKHLSHDYAKAMWLAKFIRFYCVAVADNHFRAAQMVHGIDEFGNPVMRQEEREPSPDMDAWRKYANKVYRTTGVTYERAMTMIPALHEFYTERRRVLEKLYHFADMIKVSPQIAAIPWEGDIFALVKRLEAAEQEWRKTLGEKSIPVNPRDKVIIDDKEIGEPGWFWVLLDRNYCRDEAASMGHCASGKGGNLISLRQTTNFDDKGKPIAWRAWVTADYDPQRKTLGEIKGPANSKPGERNERHNKSVQQRNAIVRKAIAALFRWEGVVGFTKGSYKPQNDFRPDDLDDEHFDTLPDRPGLFAGSVKGWTKKYGTDTKSFRAFLESLADGTQRPSIDLTDEMVKHFDPKAAAEIIDNPKWTNGDVTMNIWTSGLTAASYVHAFGQTPVAVHMMTSRKSYVTDDDVSHLKGAALKAMYQRNPSVFKSGNYIRVQRLLGVKASAAEILEQYMAEKGTKRIASHELESLSKTDLKELHKKRPELFDANLFLRTFGSKDPEINAIVADIDRRLDPEVFQEIGEDSRGAIVSELIRRAPSALALTFNNTLEGGWNPGARLFVWKEYSNAHQMIAAEKLNTSSSYRRNDNSIKWMADVTYGDDDGLYYHDWGPHDKMSRLIDDFLKPAEIECFVDYARRNYEEEVNEFENFSGDDAIELLEEHDDEIIETLKNAWADGSMVGYRDEVIDSFWREISNKKFEGQVADKYDIELAYENNGTWGDDPTFDAKVVAGFSPETFLEMIKDDQTLQELVDDQLELGSGGFYSYDRDFYGFNKEAAIDYFLENCEDEELRKAISDLRHPKKKVNEGLRGRLKW